MNVNANALIQIVQVSYSEYKWWHVLQHWQCNRMQVQAPRYFWVPQGCSYSVPVTALLPCQQDLNQLDFMLQLHICLCRGNHILMKCFFGVFFLWLKLVTNGWGKKKAKLKMDQHLIQDKQVCTGGGNSIVCETSFTSSCNLSSKPLPLPAAQDLMVACILQ